MTFRTPLVLGRRARTQPQPQGLARVDSVAPERRAYGSSSLSVIQQVDLYTPEGAFIQYMPNAGPAPGAGSTRGETLSFDTPSTIMARSKNAQKKERQWLRWANEVIPALLAPYMAILHESNSLRDFEPQAYNCLCGSKDIEVVCVYFESMGILDQSLSII
jgi:hypothetical protein